MLIQGVPLETFLFFGALLLVLSVLASRISSTFGVPALLIFLGIGMLAGSEGIGSIPFENYSLAFGVGSVCLAFVIFDGGLRTSWSSVRPILPLGISLSFVGTVVTGLLTGGFAYGVLGLGWLESLLLGGIVSSTDAAAVFSLLRSRGLGLKGKLKQVLEFEAGSNDPVAVFFTVAVLSLITAAASAEAETTSGAVPLIVFFLKQAGFGLLFGWLGGKGIRFFINQAGVEFEGLYGVLTMGLVIVLFSATAFVDGSGFLAVYVAGLVLGKTDFLHKGSISRFLDGIAWVAQIVIFLVLGLLVFPSKLVEVWQEGLMLAAFMMLIARPLSVLIAAPGRTLARNDRLFVSWVGLRGAAPIILATLPWSLGLPNAEYFFNLVFFLVLTSVLIQGASIPWVADRLGVVSPVSDEANVDHSFSQVLPPGFIPFEIVVSSDRFSSGVRIVDIGLPAGVLLTSIERGERYLVPRGDTLIQRNDKVKGLARESNIEQIRKVAFGLE